MFLAPRYWFGHLLMVLAVAAAGGLGLWQYHAYEKHREIESQDLMSQPSVAFTSLIGPDDPFPGDQVGRQVTLSGTWVPDSEVIIDRDGQRWLAQALQVTGSQSAVYVVLGSSNHSDLQSQAQQGRTPTFTGWLQPPEGTGDEDDDPTDNTLTQLRIADLIQHVDIDLFSAFVISQQPPAGLVGVHPDQLPKADSSTGLRNLLYAFEWWVFGGFAVFMWWTWVKEIRRGDGDGTDSEEPATSEPIGSAP